MKIDENFWIGALAGGGIAFLTVFLIHEFQKEQMINLGNKAIDSGMFNNMSPSNSSPGQNMSPSNSSPGQSGNIIGGL